MTTAITVTTTAKRQILDLTSLVEAELAKSKVKEGLCHLFVAHTTAAVTIGEMGERTPEDFLAFLDRITPDMEFQHTHDPRHAPDHMIGSLVGPSLTIPIANGRLVLGTWQRIYFVELDGPRERQVALTMIS
jgi:secondary thiamine-phosphate synthase enzyme